ncbi:MAG: TonB C-terminal domain-containing protein [Proteobacteria bacterium]|nr:TonB C-terminal domain-containing protein [Desulfobacteraceae bacterium]MBU4013971.1 TonB C-terminal domain-containing protein [Pseudomonadota bacterium]MBU4100155.1 TonB C-terminal domain-containing protein [Pseudomonadota bacterium]
MKESMFAASYLFRDTGNDSLSLFLTFAVSLACHAIFLAVLIYFPIHTPYNKKFSPSVINVSMVTLPAQGSASGPSGQIELKSKIQSTQPQKAQVSKIPSETSIKAEESRSKAVSVAPKKSNKIKESLKKKTFKSSDVVKSAIKNIEKQVEDSRPTQVIEAINRLKSEVGSSEARDVGVKGGGLAGQGGNIPGGGLIMGYQALKPIDIYKAEIPYHIEKNWAFSEQLSGGDTDLVAVVIIKIMQNGEIKDIWFEKKSGNSYFDESAFKAVKKSDPLPKLPKEYLKSYYNVGLIFTPSGLKKGMIE